MNGPQRKRTSRQLRLQKRVTFEIGLPRVNASSTRSARTSLAHLCACSLNGRQTNERTPSRHSPVAIKDCASGPLKEGCYKRETRPDYRESALPSTFRRSHSMVRG